MWDVTAKGQVGYRLRTGGVQHIAEATLVEWVEDYPGNEATDMVSTGTTH